MVQNTQNECIDTGVPQERDVIQALPAESPYRHSTRDPAPGFEFLTAPPSLPVHTCFVGCKHRCVRGTRNRTNWLRLLNEMSSCGAMHHCCRMDDRITRYACGEEHIDQNSKKPEIGRSKVAISIVGKY